MRSRPARICVIAPMPLRPGARRLRVAALDRGPRGGRDPFGTVVCLFHGVRRHDGTEIDERASDRRGRDHADLHAVLVGQVTRVVDDDVSTPHAHLHRYQHFDHAAGLESVESVERGCGSMRGDARRAAVEASGEHRLVPRRRRADQAEDPWRHAFDQQRVAKPPQRVVAHIDRVRLGSREEPELGPAER